ncbi:hypothetical protein FOXB_12430 [Fusarium oxysporum f. sp. conglutinans Fo5176]|uniref:Uncharacterized protein n=1 Tax=Fusarium oxysporum (strain Fo5176) TaxID=660025 RepID=F9G198_FUSOF|nr:hypothetical protein FOXB_12430 [Fusarium oxysporum f. sp. conglutinans Fo5176]
MPTNEECHSNLGWHKLASLTQDGRAEAVGLKSLDAGEFQYWIATKGCESLGSLQEVNPLRDGDLGSF